MGKAMGLGNKYRKVSFPEWFQSRWEHFVGEACLERGGSFHRWMCEVQGL